MNLTKRIDLHYGQSPVKGDTQDMQKALSREAEFCAIYAESDLPADVHNRTNDHMLRQFGVHSQFAKDNGSYVRPYLVSTETGLATVGILDATAETLRGSGFKVGGTFINMGIAEQVLGEFKKLGYEVNKKYE